MLILNPSQNIYNCVNKYDKENFTTKLVLEKMKQLYQ